MFTKNYTTNDCYAQNLQFYAQYLQVVQPKAYDKKGKE